MTWFKNPHLFSLQQLYVMNRHIHVWSTQYHRNVLLAELLMSTGSEHITAPHILTVTCYSHKSNTITSACLCWPVLTCREFSEECTFGGSQWCSLTSAPFWQMTISAKTSGHRGRCIFTCYLEANVTACSNKTKYNKSTVHYTMDFQTVGQDLLVDYTVSWDGSWKVKKKKNCLVQLMKRF